ncbi:hypothetical protein EUTSA_v10003101mg [Eutrema salsugineum]|uniref:Ubiquitin-like protease family profile domain-containing protein n=1 Tax=Eutrema salsugineum TaxID=72664 RepID=V4L5K1_EUTSA|nr:hypothetical protein EUTSA_v10003101mg [Eutrema salsugineum]
MASASGSKDYPQRLYPEGKSPLLKKSFHHNCKLHNLHLTSFIWSAKTVQYFVSNQLKVDRNHEFWTLIGGRPVRFSLFEYAEITGLNCDPIDPNDKLEIDHTEFWAEIGVRGGEGPNWNELEARMKTCQAWTYEKKKMLALLFILHVGVLGLHRNSRIPLALAKTVMDEAAFERQSWVHYGFHEIIYSIKIADLGGARYTLHGCVQAMLVWGYECIPIFAERAGKIGPRFFFILVRVRYLMVVKPLEEIYPVHNMICDILDGSLDEGFWESPKNVDGDATVQTPKQSKRKLETPRVEKKKKEKVKEAEATDSTPRSKRRREREEREKQRENESKKKEPAVEKEDRTNEILMAINGLSTTVALLNSNVSSAVICIDHLDKRIAVIKDKHEEKDEAMENSGNQVDNDHVDNDENAGDAESKTSPKTPKAKASPPAAAPLAGTSMGGGPGTGTGAVEKDPSWMMEMQETSEPGFPVARVVRTPASRGKKVTKVKKEPADPKEKNQSGTKSKPDLKDKNEETQIINISDVSRPVQSRRVQIPSLQDEDDSAIEAMKKRLDKLVEHAKNPPAEKEKRGRSLASTQVSPYLGNSVVRRIMDPAGPPPGRYDPFEAVDSRILDKLTRYVAFEAEKQLESPYAGGEFYLTLMTPKESWPRKEYGWLHDQTSKLFGRRNKLYSRLVILVGRFIILACLGENYLGRLVQMIGRLVVTNDMFRQRSMRYPSPYKGGRVAFIDPIFCRVWCGDYRTKFLPNEKSLIFSDGYLDVANGHYDYYLPTYKKWGTDVDFVYIAHNMNNEHWVAVEVDIPKKKIRVFDCIPDLHRKGEVEESVKPYARMIPLLLKHMAPLELKKGDYGVFTLKTIECLALCHKWDQLKDSNMPLIRMKYAAEIYDEVHEADESRMSDPNPRSLLDDKYGFQTDSAN